MDQEKDKWGPMASLIAGGFTLIPLKGKSKFPFPGFPNTPYEMELDKTKFPENYGVLLRDDILVVDVDPRNFEDNDKPHVRLFNQLGMVVKDNGTPIVRTGSGGLHIYFRKPLDFHTRESIKGFRGIDFKSTGGRFMVGPGSLHPDTKEPYLLIQGDFTDIPDAPEELLKLLKSNNRRRPHEEILASDNLHDDPDDCERYKQFLETTTTAVEGESGDKQTYQVACKGYNYGLSQTRTFELMLNVYNPRCLPPWSHDDLWKKVESAYKYAQGKAGDENPEKEKAFKKIMTSVKQKGHAIKWDRTDKGGLKSTIQNCVNFFVLENSELAGCVAYDEFQGEVKIIAPLPWHRKTKIPHQVTMWTDDDTGQCRFYLNHKFGFDPKSQLLDEAVLVAAHFFTIHPVREFLQGLVWDSVPRVNNWLTTYANVPEDVYSREVGKKVLVQAVARIFSPGVKVDNVMILEGAQGIGKSSLISIIGGKWYADIVIDPHHRDTVDAMRGKWIIEFSEMEVARRSDAQALKAFITRQTDRVRLAYGRRSIDFPRQCVFMGTINPDATQEYLTDTTGNRRFWPVVCGNVEFAQLERDRDQLLAEAVDLYFKGENLFVEDKHVLKAMVEEQADRMVSDPWTENVAEYVNENEFVRDHNFVTTREIWEFGLRGSPTLFSKIHANRICSIMRRLGWSYSCHWHPTKKTKMKAFRKQGFVDFGIPAGVDIEPREVDIFS